MILNGKFTTCIVNLYTNNDHPSSLEHPKGKCVDSCMFVYELIDGEVQPNDHWENIEDDIWFDGRHGKGWYCDYFRPAIEPEKRLTNFNRLRFLGE